MSELMAGMIKVFFISCLKPLYFFKAMLFIKHMSNAKNVLASTTACILSLNMSISSMSTMTCATMDIAALITGTLSLSIPCSSPLDRVESE